MVSITKGQPPKELIEFSKMENATYEDFTHKELLRNHLLSEQNFTCAYCMCRIENDSLHTGIEHWHSQAKYPSEDLKYKNLHAVCSGNSGHPEEQLHCDKAKAIHSDPKGKPDLFYQPTDRQHPVNEMIRYSGNGEIISNDSNLTLDIKMLNLNVAKLKNRRKSVIVAIDQALNSKPGKTVSKSGIEKIMANWKQKTANKLPEFYGVAVYFLEKRLARS
jgi:uncharacterized protein (TIGR02646 family)